ncbi:MAG: LysR family transcriptional regulator [Lewinellaceae bacterium]|nr:LysR family transcriptional regulator [Lewinella sp.]MCB9278030.1 LysR family transcriptional regulator [Lewinellaceae bacterium]
MNLQQLEYIVAVDITRHFVSAAERCFVTQATLSMMIKKLEEELGVVIFDRSKQPVVPTETGQRLIEQAQTILHEINRMKEIVQEEKDEVRGTLKLGIIPTLAPYLLPLFLRAFMKKYPLVNLQIFEMITDTAIQKLKQNELDIAIMATPVNNPALREEPLFYEQFVVYASSDEKLMKKKYLLADDIDVNRLWLLEEGHCLRSQVINLCELKKREKEAHRFDFETGSIETLKKLVDTYNGVTILPELALNDLTPEQREHIRFFRSPAPVREISLVTYRHFVKKRLVEALRDIILQNVSPEMRSPLKKMVTEI